VILSPQLGAAAFKIATFLIVVSVGLLFVLDANSAEFVVTCLTLVIGIVFGTLVVVIARRQSR
jgi:hypothetical protein